MRPITGTAQQRRFPVPVKRFKDYTEKKSIHGLMQTGLYYGSTSPKVETALLLSLGAFHVEFKQYLINGLWITWMSIFMGFHKNSKLRGL
jgi:hypothetical protein